MPGARLGGDLGEMQHNREREWAERDSLCELGVITEIFSGTPSSDLKPDATYP